ISGAKGRDVLAPPNVLDADDDVVLNDSIVSVVEQCSGCRQKYAPRECGAWLIAGPRLVAESVPRPAEEAVDVGVVCTVRRIDAVLPLVYPLAPRICPAQVPPHTVEIAC